MLLVIFLIIGALLFGMFYSFMAGIADYIAHKYLTTTFKGGIYSHDHRFCAVVGKLWPIFAFYYLFQQLKIFLQKLYDYPQKLVEAMEERKKKIQGKDAK